jgi:hypothetical protein
VNAALRSGFRQKAAIGKMKEKNAALCRDAATLVTAGTEAKAAAQHRRKGAGVKAGGMANYF